MKELADHRRDGARGTENHPWLRKTNYSQPWNHMEGVGALTIRITENLHIAFASPKRNY